jgi:uncharacterized membrane protein YeaQ/YmgE (transglycosylase-associated protein family)
MSVLGYSIYELLMFLAVATICGGIGQALAGYSVGGCLFSLVLGFGGAWLGAWAAEQLGLPPLYILEFNGQAFPIVWAIIGSVLFAVVLSLLTQRAMIDV